MGKNKSGKNKIFPNKNRNENIGLENSNDINMKIPTSICEDGETDAGGDKYFSFALWSLAITDGKLAENPGM